MMKNKYQRMSKEEKKNLIIKYKETEQGKFLLKKLRNLFIIGSLSYVYAIFLIITAKSFWEYFLAGSLLIAGCVFIIGSLRLRIKNLNKYAIKNK